MDTESSSSNSRSFGIIRGACFLCEKDGRECARLNDHDFSILTASPFFFCLPHLSSIAGVGGRTHIDSQARTRHNIIISLCWNAVDNYSQARPQSSKRVKAAAPPYCQAKEKSQSDFPSPLHEVGLLMDFVQVSLLAVRALSYLDGSN